MNAVARAQLTFQMLTLLKNIISPRGETLCLYGVTWDKTWKCSRVYLSFCLTDESVIILTVL